MTVETPDWKLPTHPLTVTEVEILMERLANAPKEEMGKRTPGERGMYERHNVERDTARHAAMGTGLHEGMEKKES